MHAAAPRSLDMTGGTLQRGLVKMRQRLWQAAAIRERGLRRHPDIARKSASEPAKREKLSRAPWLEREFETGA